MTLWAVFAVLLCALGLGPLLLSAAQSLRLERDSLSLGQAVFLAQDLSERLHLNAIASDRYRLDWGQLPTGPGCREAACSRTDWAAADLAQWRGRVQRELPDADAWLQAWSQATGPLLLVLAWSTGDSAAIDLPSTLPVRCPAGKRCLAVTLSP